MDEFLRPNASFFRILDDWKKYGSITVGFDFDRSTRLPTSTNGRAPGSGARYAVPTMGEVTVRLQKAGRIVNGLGADTDIVVASAKASIVPASSADSVSSASAPAVSVSGDSRSLIAADGFRFVFVRAVAAVSGVSVILKTRDR